MCYLTTPSPAYGSASPMGGVLPFSIMSPIHLTINNPCYPIIQAPQCPKNVGRPNNTERYDPWLWSEKNVQNVPQPRIITQRSLCHPPPLKTRVRNFPIYSSLVKYLPGGSWQHWVSHCNQRTEYGQGIWMYPSYIGYGHITGTPSLRLPVRHWWQYGCDLAPPPFCTFWC